MTGSSDNHPAAVTGLADAEAEIERLASALTRVTSEVDVLRQRLREEIEGRAIAEAEKARLGDELSYLRSEVLTGDEVTRRGGLFGLRGRGPRPGPTPPRPPTPAAPAPASRRDTRRRDGDAATARSEELDAALQRRMFGE